MLPALSAEQQLSRIEAAAMPHVDDSTRRDVFRPLARQAGAERARPATSDDLAAIGIRTKEVPRV